MALSLLAGYSSAEDSDSDSDDGINVVIHKNPQPKRQLARATAAAAATGNKRGHHQATKVAPEAASLKRSKICTAAAGAERTVVGAKMRPKCSNKVSSVLNNDHHPELDGFDEATVIPLPSTVLTMFDKTAEQEALDQAAALHGGRVRTFKHEKNNWASYVYIDVSDIDLEEVRNFLLTQLELEPTDDAHISLSRTVSLRHHWIDPVIQGVSQAFKEIDRFTVKLDKLQVYCNDERTRTFVGLEATGGSHQLTKLTKAVDRVFGDFSLPPFYHPPSFHVSLGWCLGDKTKDISPILPTLEFKLLDVIEDVDDFGKLFIKSAHCKSGNRYFDFKLK